MTKKRGRDRGSGACFSSCDEVARAWYHVEGGKGPEGGPKGPAEPPYWWAQ